jgi:Lon-like protease
VLPLITIDGAQTYDSDGRLLLTTVNIGRANLYYALRAWADPSASLLSEDEVIPPGKSDREYKQVSLSQMDQSKIAGVAVALERETDYPEEHGPGVVVYDSVPGAPADGRLFPGDLIVEIDGDRLSDIAELDAAIEEAGTGRALHLEVRPLEGGESRDVALTPVEDQETGEAVVGIYPVPNFPLDIKIESGTIGGPSAGLMWSLGVSDLLTSEDLTGGSEIAGTGTVDLDGNVGPIGGIALKIEAAEQANAETFLLPPQNLAEARTADADIELVTVSTVDQALEFLEGRG